MYWAINNGGNKMVKNFQEAIGWLKEFQILELVGVKTCSKCAKEIKSNEKRAVKRDFYNSNYHFECFRDLDDFKKVIEIIDNNFR